MKRHTTRKRNRLLKRMAARRAWELCEAEQSIKRWLSYKMGCEIDKNILKALQTPTVSEMILYYPNVQISLDNSEISPTTEY